MGVSAEDTEALLLLPSVGLVDKCPQGAGQASGCYQRHLGRQTAEGPQGRGAAGRSGSSTQCQARSSGLCGESSPSLLLVGRPWLQALPRRAG